MTDKAAQPIDLAAAETGNIDLKAEFEAANIQEVFDKLDRELVGLCAGQDAHSRDRRAAPRRARAPAPRAWPAIRRRCT